MATPLIEQQRQLGRQLGRLRRNIAEPSESDEKTGQPARLPALGFAGFIMLGGFALLKDIFDFVFVSMLNFESWQTTATNLLDMLPVSVKIGRGPWGIILGELARLGLGAWGQARDIAAQSNAIILPFLFTTMFMIVVVATLLLSGMGLKSYKIFLSTRFIVISFFGFFAEIIPGLNILPWTVIYVVILYFIVKRELKKQQEQAT